MKKLTIGLLSLLTLTACQADSETEYDDNDMAYYNPGISISAGTGSATRSIIHDTSLFPLRNFGIWLTCTDPGIQQWYNNLGYNNIRGYSSYSPTVRTYTPRGAAKGQNKIGLVKSKGPVSFYGVNPHESNFHTYDPRSIPFNIGRTLATNYDYMYTGRVDVDPNDPATLTAPFVFKHIMTLLDFRLQRTLDGPITLTSVTLSATRDGQPADIFYTGGTFNAINGEVTCLESSKVSDFKMTCNLDISSTAIETGIILPEIAYDPVRDSGTKIKISFGFRHEDKEEPGNDEELIQGSSIEFGLSEIVTNGNAAGFLTGYMYIFNFKIDNFIKYQGYPVIQEWEPYVDENGNSIIDITF